MKKQHNLAAGIAIAGFAAFGLAPSAFASPAGEMCKFVAAAAAGGSPAAIGYLDSIAKNWSDDARAKLPVVVGVEMEKFDYSDGQVYRTANLPGVVEEFFLTLNLDGIASSVYARVLYEGDGDNISFINIDFNSSYYDITQQPFMQTPTEVECG